MTAPELASLRRLLFFSAGEAALLLAASLNRIAGVQESTWREWENGIKPVPEEIAEIVRRLCEWRANAVTLTCAAIKEAKEQAKLKTPAEEWDMVIVWYATLDDWLTLNDRVPVMWRPQCSVIAEAVLCGAQLIRFDCVKYAQWLNKRIDSEELRGEWATEESSGNNKLKN
jgi:hypothetical protein